MSRDKRGNGIQEVDGSIPFGSTKRSDHAPHLRPKRSRTTRKPARRSLKYSRKAK